MNCTCESCYEACNSCCEAMSNIQCNDGHAILYGIGVIILPLFILFILAYIFGDPDPRLGCSPTCESDSDDGD